ncbi:MAG: hypothetical protein JO108_25585 [Acidobacteriaceae bacterium]|nr:hypothetical protein [Acidobacteriaceae bacterium]
MTEVKTAWNKAAGVPALLVHDLGKRLFATWCRQGFPKGAMEIGGHKTRSIFDCQSITDENKIREDGKRWSPISRRKKPRLGEKAQSRKVGTVPDKLDSANSDKALVVQRLTLVRPE